MSKSRAARISNAQLRKRKKASATAPLAVPPTGPNALFNQPGVSRSRRQKRLRDRAMCPACRLKAAGDVPTVAVHAGGSSSGPRQIAPGITRIRGNLCNVHGRYGRCPGSGGGGAKPKKGRKPAKTPEERAAERDALHAKNTQETLSKLNIAPDGQEALAALRRGEQPDPDAVARGGFEQAGLVERADDGSYRMTASGRALLSAAAAGDIGRAGDTISSARDRMAHRKPPKEAKPEKPKKGGGGGGSKGKPDKAAAKLQKRRDTAAQVGLKPAEADTLATAAEGGQVAEADVDHLAELGFIVATGNNQFAATDQGRRALSALERGDARSYQAAVQDAAARMQREAQRAERAQQAEQRRREREERRTKRRRGPSPVKNVPQTTKAETYGGTKRSNLDDSVFAGPDRSFPIKTAQDVRDAVRSLGRTKHDKAVVKRGIIRRARAIGATDALPESWREKQAAPSPSFAVFKDRRGADRWLSITTTAYEDKDQEIISCKAIGRAVAIGDTSGQRGPLRYWHVPGLDIGDCDYQAQGGPGGRFLIESGTFRSPACAQMGRTMAAKGYQMSPGFLHASSQPRNGVFDDIAIVERSPVPAGRSSNLFTRYLTKEDRMITAEKAAELKDLLADQPDLLNQLLARVEQSDKAAQGAKIAYKDAPEWAQALTDRVEALETREKAMAPASMEQAADTEQADAETEQADDGDYEEADGGDENMLTPGEIQAIASAVVQALTPLLDIEKKMAGHAADIKAAFASSATQKDATTAEQEARLKAVEGQVKELVGDLPTSVLAHAATLYRPSQAPQTTIPAQAAQRVKEELGGVPAGLNGAEADAYRLIFGNS